ncbi:amino acid adenylation domain-containing protein [Micromonospora sp. NPDC048999]|uniref:amino acid adenylation domain-containing protein n=1 Tax=Micromonospora sp. NPDC048999 TaxID=3155391 RepID=UPI0033D5DF85
MSTFVADLPAHDAPAIVTLDRMLSYTELVARVEGLAGRLAAGGVGPERVCVVALERGPEAVIAIAAVLRAGAAFLAVDVDLPDQRIASLVTGADALLTTAALAQRFATLDVPGPTILLDGPGPTAAPPSGVAPRSLAYVSHTSGSTGTPNAVLIEHRWLHAYLRFVARDHRLGPDTVAVQLAPLGFDASIRDIFAPLVAGGRLVMLPRSALLRPDEFLAALDRFEVNTMLSVTPSFLTFLARHDGVARRLRGLRLVGTTGESMRPFLASGGRHLISGRLVNQYGPTEGTMTATRFEVPVAADTTADLIGTPIDGVAVRLLDNDLRPVPDGSPGEVCIASAGVARGYAGRPALTAERFMPDPFGAPGTRLYRTGDLARRRPDGNLEYLGRADRQIKIRGYRVDPAEVEGVLLTHPAVTGAAVTAVTDEQARTYLVAHLTGELAEVGDAALRGYLAQKLPPHMMPRRFARLTRFPTTRTGKIDRRALTAGGVR